MFKSKSKAKKPKLTEEQQHRQLREQVEALPYVVTDHRTNGRWFKAFLVERLVGPMIRFQKRTLDKKRYAGADGQKLKQSEAMKRRLEMQRKQMEFMQGEMARQQKKAQKRNKAR